MVRTSTSASTVMLALVVAVANIHCSTYLQCAEQSGNHAHLLFLLPLPQINIPCFLKLKRRGGEEGCVVLSTGQLNACLRHRQAIVQHGVWMLWGANM